MILYFVKHSTSRTQRNSYFFLILSITYCINFYLPNTQLNCQEIRKDLPATPALEGFGTTTVGGSGRHTPIPKTTIVPVTSLADSGPGSLRECVDHMYPRTCIFLTSGEIVLRSPLTIDHPYITIAGQSAPAPGITVSHSSLRIRSHDVLVQHMSFRPGDCPFGTKPSERDGISIGSPSGSAVFNIVVDHVSMTWAIDENITVWFPTSHDITISNSIIAEGLHKSLHPKGPHSKGVMIGPNVKDITLYRNLIALNYERNPYIQAGSTVEFINNVVYGWGGAGPWCLAHIRGSKKQRDKTQAVFRGNYYISGPISHQAFFLYARNLARNSSVLMQDNAMSYSPIGFTTRFNAHQAIPSLFWRSSIDSKKVLSSKATLEYVLRNAGSRPWARAKPDANIVTAVRTGDGAHRDTAPPCIWHAHQQSLNDREPSSRSVPFRPQEVVMTGSGYTNLEIWLQNQTARSR